MDIVETIKINGNRNSKILKYIISNHIYNFNLRKFEELVIQTGNAAYIYYFAKHIKNSNVKKLQDAIIKTGNVEYMYYFMRDIKGANTRDLKYAIIKIKGEKYIQLIKEDKELQYLKINQIIYNYFSGSNKSDKKTLKPDKEYIHISYQKSKKIK